MRKLLVAVDGSEQSLKAVDFASELARKHKAELCLVNVIKEETLLQRLLGNNSRTSIGQLPAIS